MPSDDITIDGLRSSIYAFNYNQWVTKKYTGKKLTTTDKTIFNAVLRTNLKTFNPYNDINYIVDKNCKSIDDVKYFITTAHAIDSSLNFEIMHLLCEVRYVESTTFLTDENCGLKSYISITYDFYIDYYNKLAAQNITHYDIVRDLLLHKDFKLVTKNHNQIFYDKRR